MLNKILTSTKRIISKLTHRSSTVRTSSGKEIKVNRTLSEHIKAKKDLRARRKAQYKASMPKSRLKRFVWRLHPKRLAKYWFSREGAIMALKITGIGIIIMMIAGIGVFAYFRKDLPNIQDINANAKGGSIRYYDRNGTILFEDFESFKRIPVQYDSISQYMKDATIAIEDKDFFNHGGFNLKGIIRATINNARGGSTQGGSTITQQFVKNTQDWSKDRTVTRKIKELILSVELERSYSKKDILAGYLNVIPYGAFEVGVETASQTYFGKSAKDLTLEESAFLVAIPQAPSLLSVYSPDFDLVAFNNRKDHILDLMAEQGKITNDQRDEAKKVDLTGKVLPRKNKYEGIKSPYFVLAAKDELEATYGKNFSQNGWEVYLTIDPTLQAAAEEVIANGMVQVRRQGGNNAAFVAEESKTGKVVAMVGGADFNNEQFGKINFATTPRAPGSSVKPYDYAALMQQSKHWGAASVIYDVKTPFDGWPVSKPLTDYDKKYPGPLTMRYALAGSRNVPAVKAMYMAGIENVRKLQREMGLVSGLNCPSGTCGLASALGDGAELKLNEHVAGYSTFARNGTYKKQTFIQKIVDGSKKTIYEWKDTPDVTKEKQVLDPQIAYIIGDMTSDPKASYLANKGTFSLNGHQISVKTGTTDQSDNGWMMGFSNIYTAGVWVGRNDAKPMGGFMETMTQPIFTNFMRKAHENVAAEKRIRPDGLKEIQYDIASSISFKMSGHASTPSKDTDLFPSWYTPLNDKSLQKKAVIDTVSGKLATECTPERAKQEVTSGKASVELPTSDPQYSVWAKAITDALGTSAGAIIPTENDDVHKCEDARPTVALSISGSGSSFIFTANVGEGTHPLTTVNFKIDGQILPGGSIEYTGSTPISFPYESEYDGSHEISVEVVDSALYDATDSDTIIMVSASAFTASASKTGNKIHVTCNIQGSPVDSYEIVIENTVTHILYPGTDSDCDYMSANLPGGTYSVYVKAKDGSSTVKTSNTVTVTI